MSSSPLHEDQTLKMAKIHHKTEANVEILHRSPAKLTECNLTASHDGSGGLYGSLHCRSGTSGVT
ncbi:hypothetical protein HMPREF0185_01202 [Brevundimonas diminuta 470-4]|nr:hypothetical protein HMPREF0185_01202 [Brevundimonas diminuta 470-4]